MKSRHEDIHVRPGRAEEVIALRQLVLRPGRPREASIYDVDALPTTRHLVAVAAGDGRVVGCATIFPEPFDGRADAWRLRGMAVDPELRGGGVGRRILEAMDDMMRTQTPVPLLWCNARVTAIGFYERCGWQVASGEFDVPGIGPHVNMTRQA